MGSEVAAGRAAQGSPESSDSHQHHAPIEPIGFTDRPGAVKRFFWSFYALCGILLVVEPLVPASGHPHPWEESFGFYMIAGFVSFWFLVLVAKLMRRVLIRPEDYYQPPDSQPPDGGSDNG